MLRAVPSFCRSPLPLRPRAAAAPAPQRFLCARCTPTGAPLPVAFPPAASARRLQAPHAAHHVSGLRLPPLERLFGGSAEEAAGAAADTGLLSALHEWLGAVACGAHGALRKESRARPEPA